MDLPRAILDLRIFPHAQDLARLRTFLETPGAGDLRQRSLPAASAASEGGEVLRVGETARKLLRELALPEELRVIAEGGLHLAPGRALVGRNLARALSPRELEFLVLSQLYPHRVGLASLVGLQDLPVGPGEVVEGAFSALTSWIRALRFSSDRFATALLGVDLPLAGRALFKAACLGGESSGGEKSRPAAISCLDGFRPRAGDRGGDFRPYRELLADYPVALERAWELSGFLRSRQGMGLASLDVPRLLDPALREEESPPASRAAPKSPMVQVPSAPRAASSPGQGTRTGPGLRGLERPRPLSLVRDEGTSKARPLGQVRELPAPGTDSLYYLSAYRRDLRILGPEGITVVDLSEHCKLPTHLAVAPAGDLWIGDGETGRILHLDASGSLVGTLEGFPRSSGGLQVDSQGRLLVVDRGRSRILVSGPDGKILRELGEAVEPALGEILGLAPGALGESLWIVEAGRGRLLRLDRAGRPLTTVDLRATWSGVDRPLSLCSDGEEGVWVLDGTQGRLVRFGPGGIRRQVLVPPGTPQHLRLGKVCRRGRGDLAVLDLERGRVTSWSADLRFLGQIDGLATPEDGFGYSADLEPGPGLRVRSILAAPAVDDGERKCARST